MHQLKKECTSWEVWVKFYLGQNKDYSQETAFQIVPRNFSEEVGWEVSTYVILVKAEYVHLSPCFFLQKVDRCIYSSVTELLLFTRLMAYYQNIFSVFLWKSKLCRHHWFVFTPPVTFSSPQFTNFVDQQNVGWEKSMNCCFFHMKSSDQLHPHVQKLILKMLFSRPRLDLKNQKFWEVVLHFGQDSQGTLNFEQSPETLRV